MGISDLDTLGNAQRKPRARQKGLPAVLAKEAKREAKEAVEDAFRRAIWIRDKGQSRASGVFLSRSAMDWKKRGEVHHVLKRSTNPDGKYDVARGILLSKTEHTLAETRCPQAPEFMLLTIRGPEDLGQLQTFTWRDVDGKVIKERVG